MYTRPLSWKDRPDDLKQLITKAWEALKDGDNDEWKYKGETDRYYLFGIDEFELLARKIRKLPSRKTFYVLDIGAGHFGWGKAFVSYLNHEKDLPDDVTVHVIGIRGEKHEDKVAEKVGKCVLHEYGHFQIENLIDEFKKRGLELEGKLDLIVSRMTMRHLVAPLFTLLQAYELLAEGHGLLFSEGFYFDIKGYDYHSQNKLLLSLLKNSKVPYLCYQFADTYRLDYLALNRPTGVALTIDLEYLGVTTLAPESRRKKEANSGYISQFICGMSFKVEHELSPSTKACLVGDGDFYWYLLDLFEKSPFDKGMPYADLHTSLELIIKRKYQALGVDELLKELKEMKSDTLSDPVKIEQAFIQLAKIYAKLSAIANYAGMRWVRPDLFGSSRPYDPLIWQKIHNQIWLFRDSSHDPRGINTKLAHLEKIAAEHKFDPLPAMRKALDEITELSDSERQSIVAKTHEKGFLDQPCKVSQVFQLIGKPIIDRPWAVPEPKEAAPVADYKK